MKKLFSQSGVIHSLSLFLIIAAIGLISFLLISSTAPTGGLLGELNPKSQSHAAVAAPTGSRLRDLAGSNFLIGYASANDFWNLSDATQYQATAASEFNFLTPENQMKFAATEPQQGVFSFTAGDQHVAFAQAHGMKVHGHNLLWGSSNPSWLANGNWTASTLTQVMYNHIDNVVGHWKGKIAVWDVVNEPINTASIWNNVIGPSYIDLALRRAHQDDPNACLIINEYSDDQLGGAADTLYSMAQNLLAQGSPLCGVGMQMHFVFGADDPNSIAQNMQRFADLGLQIYITEMDVAVGDNPPTPGDLTYQANTYQSILDVCLKQPACKALQMWGFTDKYTWIPSTFSGRFAPLVFDSSYSPKPAYYALQTRLAQQASATPSPTPGPSLPVDTYTTNFPLTENSISENGIWLSGKRDGLDWSDVKTTTGKVFGTQTGSSSTVYDDSVAVLKGTFGANQEANATVFNNRVSGDWNSEVELHLRSGISAHSVTGYEIEYSTRADNTYCDIVRWNGSFNGGQFWTPLLHVAGGCGVKTGDIVRATMIGNVITAYINGIQVMQTTDNTFTSGNPGVGFYLRNISQTGDSSAYGFTNFTAKTITSTPTPTPTPTPGVESVFNGPHNLPGTLQFEDYDNGGEGLAYHDLDSANQGGQYRTDSVDIQTTTDTGGGFLVGWTQAGEWLKYMVNVTATGKYDLNFRVASQGAGGTFHLEVDGTDVTGAMTIPDTTNWQTFTTLTKPSVSLSSGAHTLRLVMDTNGSTGFIGNFNYLTIAQSSTPNPTPTLTPTPSPTVSPCQGADIDKNGKVDIFDYNIVVTNFGQTGTGIQGDVDGNNKIDIFDYNILVSNFGKTGC